MIRYWKVQLPDYPCRHIVTGFGTIRGASGRTLLVAEAEYVREGLSPRKVHDIVTMMLLHDAVMPRAFGEIPKNDIKLYGRQALREQSQHRINNARVEEVNS